MRRLFAAVLLCLLSALALLVWQFRPAALILLESAGLITPPPVAAQFVISSRNGVLYQDDLYPATAADPVVAVPSTPPAPPVCLVIEPGAAMAGKNDPKVRALASALAHAGFTVLLPDSPGQRALHLGPENRSDLEAAVLRLRPRCARLGVLAISYGVGPMLQTAAALPDKIDFLVGIGGYRDIPAVLGWFLTGRYRDPVQGWIQRQPDPYGRWLFLRANASRLPSANDRTLLEMIAARKMQQPDADSADLTAPLTVDGRAVIALYQASDPEQIEPLLARLPSGVRADLAALELSDALLRSLPQPVLLIHGANDQLVPPQESRKLAALIPHARLIEVPAMSHTDWNWRSLSSLLPLLRATQSLLVLRDGGSL